MHLLDQVSVVEWGRGLAVAYASKLLADLGASVVRIPTDAPDPRRDQAEVRAWVDDGKRDGAASGARLSMDDLADCITQADVLITDYGEREMSDRLPSGKPTRVNPQLVCVCVSPFGLTGPYRQYRGGDLELAFLSGLAYLTPRDIARPEAAPLPPPLKMPSSLVSIYAGASTAAAALCGLLARERGLRAGGVADVSVLETLVPVLRREIALAEMEGRVASRFMRVWRLAPYGVKPCRDGHVFLQVVERYHWEGLVDMMGAPDWARDSRYLDSDFRYDHREDVEARLAPWLLAQSKADFAWEAQRRGLPFAAINAPADVVGIPQLHERRFFRGVTEPDGRPRVVPGVPFLVIEGVEARRDDTTSAPVHHRGPGPNPADGPLSGLRVIDFGHVWAGPYCAALLADMGAEVIKVESRQRIDIHRRQGPYAKEVPGVDRSGVWNAQNRGKRSVTLNLATEEGRALARRLVAHGDVVVENFAPGVMKRLGLGFRELSEVKRDIVMVSLSAFGQDGPQRSFVGYGPSLDAWASLDWLTAYPGGTPNALGGMFPDTGSALHAVAAVLAALVHRDRTGRGQYVDVSELEVSVLLAADVLSGALAGHPQEAQGNGDPHIFPHGCYRCKGDDEWIALSVPDEFAWRGLAAVLSRRDWRDDHSLSTTPGRRARAPEIDGAIATWATNRVAKGAMQELQRAHVPCGMAHTAQSLLLDRQLQARRFFQRIAHGVAGEQTIYGPIWRFDGAGPRKLGPAPQLGADNAYVLKEIVGLGAEEYDALIAAGIVY